jgi:hypothetical protein
MNPATLNPGNLGRWFEELCRIKHKSLREIVVSSGIRLVSAALPEQGGVYAFWWTGSTEYLSEKMARKVILKGRTEKPVSLQFDDEWLGLSTKLPIPLYVGKTAAGLTGRVGGHLRLSTERLVLTRKGAEKAAPPSSDCQLRAGIDHIFPDVKDTRTLMLDNVGLSYVILDSDEHAAHRFYLEDLAIGLMHPPFNIDIER